MLYSSALWGGAPQGWTIFWRKENMKIVSEVDSGIYQERGGGGGSCISIDCRRGSGDMLPWKIVKLRSWELSLILTVLFFLHIFVEIRKRGERGVGVGALAPSKSTVHPCVYFFDKAEQHITQCLPLVSWT